MYFFSIEAQSRTNMNIKSLWLYTTLNAIKQLFAQNKGKQRLIQTYSIHV